MLPPRAAQNFLKCFSRSYSAIKLNTDVEPRLFMTRPGLYGSTNDIQREITLKYFEELKHKLNWNKNGDTAIDVGCGDGSVSMLIKNGAPCKFKKYVMSDVSEAMIQYAKKRYEDGNIICRILDIEQDLPQELVGEFNHVFSLYALHWVKKQEKAFKNIYDLLKDKGDCLLLFLATTGIYDVYSVLAQHPKWESWLINVDSFIGPYHKVKQPERKVSAIMEKSGFKNVEVQYNELTSVQSSLQELKNIVRAVEPFNMPDDVYDEFFEDYKKAGQETGVLHIETNSNNEVTTVKYDYALLVCHGKK